jgi:hypothetical protein
MPKIIVTSRYIKPNAHKKFGNYIKYIATREGVEKTIPKQKNNQELDRQIFMNYLDSRPNSHGLFSEKDNPIVLDKAAKEVANHKGALWTHIVSLKRTDAERMGFIDLEHWQDLVRRHISDIAAAQKIKPENIRWYAAFHNKESNPHVHIVTYSVDTKEGYLTKEGIEKIRSVFANDIYRDELQNLYQQQTLVRDKLRSETKNVMVDLLSKLQNNSEFDPLLEQLILKLQSQLKSSKGKKVYGYLQPNVKKTVDQIVAELAKNPVLKKMYDEWCSLEQQKYETYTSAVRKVPTLEENKVFKPIKNAIINAVSDMDFSVIEMEMEMSADDEMLISEDLETEKEKKTTAKKHRDNWNKECREAFKHLADKDYTSAYKEFYKIANEKPNDKILFRLGIMTLKGQGCEADRNLGIEYIKQSAELGNEYAQSLLENMNKHYQTATQNAVMSMLFSFGRLISDDYNRSLRGQNIRTEHKLKSVIRRKKQALGLKESQTEQKF